MFPVFQFLTGIKLERAAYMEASMLQNIMSLIPQHLLNLEETVEQVQDEVKEEYTTGVTKAIGKHSLITGPAEGYSVQF